MHARLAPRLATGAAATVLLLATGCTSSKEGPSHAEAPGSPSVQTSSSAPLPSPTASAPSATPDDTPLADRLLPTGEVPGLNASWRWQDGDTGEPSADPFGLCAKADLTSIGAMDSVARTYFPPDDSDDNAAEQVAEFPDARTARLAWSVLTSWHDHCASKRSANPGLVVSKIVPVPVSSGSADYYLLSWTPAGEEVGRFEEFGAVLDGTRIAVVRIDHSIDQEPTPGHEPVVGMVTAAAGRLG